MRERCWEERAKNKEKNSRLNVREEERTPARETHGRDIKGMGKMRGKLAAGKWG